MEKKKEKQKKKKYIEKTLHHQSSTVNFQYMITTQWRNMNCPTKNSKQLVSESCKRTEISTTAKSRHQYKNKMRNSTKR